MDCASILCHCVAFSGNWGRNMVKASDYRVCLASGLSLKLHWCRLFLRAPVRWSLNSPLHCPLKGIGGDLLRCHILDFPVTKGWWCEVMHGKGNAVWGSAKEGRVVHWKSIELLERALAAD